MSAAQNLAGVQDALAAAADAKIAQVVALVDGLDHRGAADALLAPLRPRLSQLRPARPPRLGRLMYLPLDPLIVPTDQWRPHLPCIPRGLLPHLTARIEGEMGPRAAELASAVRQLPQGDQWAIDTLGAMLWPEAGRLLAAARFSDVDIAETGLPPASHRALVPAIAALLRQGPGLRGVLARDRVGAAPPIGELRLLMEGGLAGGAAAFRLMVTLILKQFPHVPGVFGLAEHLGGAPAMAEVARDTLGCIAASLADGALDRHDPRARGAEISRIAALLGGMERCAAGNSPECRLSLATARAELDQNCRTSFDALLTAGLLNLVTALPPAPDDARIAALEDTARTLRAMELAARSLGDASAYQAQLAAAAARLRQEPSHLHPADRARLIEILAGPEAAADVAMVKSAGEPA